MIRWWTMVCIVLRKEFFICKLHPFQESRNDLRKTQPAMRTWGFISSFVFVSGWEEGKDSPSGSRSAFVFGARRPAAVLLPAPRLATSHLGVQVRSASATALWAHLSVVKWAAQLDFGERKVHLCSFFFTLGYFAGRLTPSSRALLRVRGWTRLWRRCAAASTEQATAQGHIHTGLMIISSSNREAFLLEKGTQTTT